MTRIPAAIVFHAARATFATERNAADTAPRSVAASCMLAAITSRITAITAAKPARAAAAAFRNAAMTVSTRARRASIMIRAPRIAAEMTAPAVRPAAASRPPSQSAAILIAFQTAVKATTQARPTACTMLRNASECLYRRMNPATRAAIATITIPIGFAVIATFSSHCAAAAAFVAIIATD
jgi:hypothetical protein